jgi:hypothetical protein
MVVEIFEEIGMEKNMLDNMPLIIPEKGLEHWRVSFNYKKSCNPIEVP